MTGTGQGRGLPSSSHSRLHLAGSLPDRSYGPQRKTLAEDGRVRLLGPWPLGWLKNHARLLLRCFPGPVAPF